MRIARTARRAAVASAAFCGLLLGYIAAPAADPTALWNVVHGQCVPNQQRSGNPAPCVEVDLTHGIARGYAVLKDIRGATQFLLLPTQRVVGIESPELRAPGAPNYFAAAWDARTFVETKVGRTMAIDTLSLAVNSELARSQTQLHIHIDCVRPDIRSALARQRLSIGEAWAPLREPLDGHPYQAMRVSGATLGAHNPFELLAQGIPDAKDAMAQYTLVVIGMTFADGAPGFVILADRIDLLHGDLASGARLQDRDCALAGQS